MTRDERIVELEAENAVLRARVSEIPQLRAQIQELVAQVQELRARLGKDSHNSSKPPASDPLGGKRPRSQRRPSGKKPRGQSGHPAEPLHPPPSPHPTLPA